MDIRTDLINEIKATTADTSGVISKSKQLGEVLIEEVYVTDKTAAKKLSKPIGKYFTVCFDRLDRITDYTDVKKAIIYCLNKLFDKIPENVLIVGLGNTDITPDALGPMTANLIIATRHISGNLRHTLGLDGLNDVSCLIPGVLGKTGIESQDIVLAAANKTRPEAIIVIDALAARDPKRLCSTFQLTNGGITPGSGVKNSRKEFSKENMHIPVIAIGMPTVTDAEAKNDMMVTPKEIDLLIKKGSEVLATALNLFLQPTLDEETIENMT